MSVELELEQKRLARHNLLLDCKIQEVPIALLSGSLEEISEVQVGAGGPGGGWRSGLFASVFCKHLRWSCGLSGRDLGFS